MAKKKRKRIRKPAPGKKQVRPGETTPKKPGGLDSPASPSGPARPKPVGDATKKTTPKPP